jgi:magnesium transporter
LPAVRHIAAVASGLREIPALVFEFSNLIEPQRTGVIARQLAAWAAIPAVPTTIAGIYSMNLEHMPELCSPYGYPITLGVILTI